MANDDAPIIIKKINKGHGGHHGGAWKVAYADFVTAMMALFIVLWILSSSSESTKEGIAAYFNDPIGFSTKSKNIIDQPGAQVMPGDRIDFEKEYREIEKEKMKEMGDEILDDVSSATDLSSLADQISIEFIEEGMRIELVESANNAFFNSGSSELNNKSQTIIKKIGSELSHMNNPIIVEGHTDARPFLAHNENYTNYELSCDRANSARRSLIKGGLAPHMIAEVRGYADKRLRDIKDPYSVLNRRVSIIIKYSDINE